MFLGTKIGLIELKIMRDGVPELPFPAKMAWVVCLFVYKSGPVTFL